MERDKVKKKRSKNNPKAVYKSSYFLYPLQVDLEEDVYNDDDAIEESTHQDYDEEFLIIEGLPQIQVRLSASCNMTMNFTLIIHRS